MRALCNQPISQTRPDGITETIRFSMPIRWLMTWQMNQVFLLTSKARSFAKEAQDDKHTVPVHGGFDGWLRY